MFTFGQRRVVIPCHRQGLINSLHKSVNQAAWQFIKKHHLSLHELMYTCKFKLKPELMEIIQATRQNPKWEPDIVIRIAENKEKAKAEDIGDKSNIKVYTDGLGVDRYIGAAAALYQDGVLKRTRRMRLGSVKHHTVMKGRG